MPWLSLAFHAWDAREEEEEALPLPQLPRTIPLRFRPNVAERGEEEVETLSLPQLLPSLSSMQGDAQEGVVGNDPVEGGGVANLLFEDVAFGAASISVSALNHLVP